MQGAGSPRQALGQEDGFGRQAFDKWAERLIPLGLAPCGLVLKESGCSRWRVPRVGAVERALLAHRDRQGAGHLLSSLDPALRWVACDTENLAA